ncbi:hypothetical protein [Kribbella sp. DT2]|uniref:hypothetical protein n=1 Tax=Kribbella sp. DT2 TaxID=3393427 RepID=UPI003CFB2867
MKLLRGALALACLLPLAACYKGRAPLEVEYDGAQLSAARAEGERRNAVKLAMVWRAAPILHEVASSRHDECDGGQWFDEDKYYWPYGCVTTSYTVLTFAGEFRTQARRIAAALDATSCSVDLARELEPQLTQVRDVTSIEPVGSDCPDSPYPTPRASLLAWSHVSPTTGQLERIRTQLDSDCLHKRYCATQILDLAGGLASARDGDRWAVVVEFGETYFEGEPTPG